MSKKIYGIPVSTPINPAKIDPVVPEDKIASSVAAYMEENPITPSSIGARPIEWMPSAEEVGAAPMDYAKKVGNPYNLLDNSDFRNPVNQRGFVSGTVGTANYTIDRWNLQYDTYLHLHSGYVGLSGFWTLTQFIGCKIFAGETYTFSVEAKSEADNVSMFMRFGDPTGTGAKEHRQAVNSNGWSKCVKKWTADRDYEPGECDFSLGINTGHELTTQIYYKNPAVYKGEYTAETLPEYQPKGYGEELAECQRYYQKTIFDHFAVCHALIGSEFLHIPLSLKFPMRISEPTFSGSVNALASQGWQGEQSVSGRSTISGFVASIAKVNGYTFESGKSYICNGTIELSADL